MALVKDRHRSREFIEFRKLLDAAYPARTAIRLILDNHSAHITGDQSLACHQADAPLRIPFGSISWRASSSFKLARLGLAFGSSTECLGTAKAQDTCPQLTKLERAGKLEQTILTLGTPTGLD
jgi:hypothetical protein